MNTENMEGLASLGRNDDNYLAHVAAGEMVVPPVITSGQYILFSKPIEVNESSLKGYYADVTLENSSSTRTELFTISSEVVPSSK